MSTSLCYVEIFVGVENSSLTVNEGDGSSVVCVEIQSPNTSTVNVLASLQTSMGTAAGIANTGGEWGEDQGGIE